MMLTGAGAVRRVRRDGGILPESTRIVVGPDSLCAVDALGRTTSEAAVSLP